MKYSQEAFGVSCYVIWQVTQEKKNRSYYDLQNYNIRIQNPNSVMFPIQTSKLWPVWIKKSFISTLTPLLVLLFI